MILITRLNNLIASGEPAKKIAKIAHKSAPSISRFVNGSHIIDLRSAVKIIKHYFPMQEKEIMTDFCVNMDRKNGRTAIEYSMVNGLEALSQILLEKLRSSGNRIDNEWARAYELEILRNKQGASSIDLLHQIYRTRADSVEMKVYLLILASYCYFDLRQIDLIQRNLLEAEYLIPQINDDFIRESYQVRLGQVLTVIFLSQNQVEDARKYGLAVIENELFRAISGPVYHAIGNSYLFDDYEQAIYYLEIARDIFIERNRLVQAQEVKDSIIFTQLFHGYKAEQLIDTESVKGKHSKVFELISEGKNQDALDLLETIQADLLPDYTKGFHYYYKGRILKQEDLYFEAIYYFKKSGDVFYRQLPCLELKKLGISPLALKALSL